MNAGCTWCSDTASGNSSSESSGFLNAPTNSRIPFQPPARLPASAPSRAALSRESAAACRGRSGGRWTTRHGTAARHETKAVQTNSRRSSRQLVSPLIVHSSATSASRRRHTASWGDLKSLSVRGQGGARGRWPMVNFQVLFNAKRLRSRARGHGH
eukprot:517126-Prymnesium_polylepis.2